jgi:hypothetical protein
MRTAPLLAILCLFSLAAPAAAQIAGRPNYGDVPRVDRIGRADSRLPGPGIGNDLRDVRGRIDDARDAGRISRGEARGYRREARAIGALASRYGADGLSPWEESELEFRAQALRSAIARPTPPRGSGR